MFGDEPSESWLAVWFRSLTMGTRIQIILFSVLGIFLAIGATIALIKEPAILLPTETPDSRRVAGEPDRPKAPVEAKVWRKGEGILAQSVEGNSSAESQGEIQAMRKLVKMSPQDPGAWDQLGKSLYGAGLYDEAVNAFRESLKLKPNVVDVLANLGVALKTKGREAEYKKLVEELTQLDAKTAKELENFVPQQRAVSSEVAKPRTSLSSVGGNAQTSLGEKKKRWPKTRVRSMPCENWSGWMIATRMHGISSAKPFIWWVNIPKPWIVSASPWPSSLTSLRCSPTWELR